MSMQFYDPNYERECISELGGQITQLMLRWADLREQLRPHVTGGPAKCVALSILARRQLVFLDGARLVAEAGRPEPLLLCVRSLYEVWLWMLVIGYYPNPQGKRGYYGRRYLAFGKYQAWKNAIDLRNHGAAEVIGSADLEQMIRTYEQRWKPHSVEFADFKSHHKHWHGLGTTAELFAKLWPGGKGACFPAAQMGFTRKLWDSFYDDSFRYASQFAHGQPSATSSYVGIEDEDELLSIEQVWQSGFLKAAYQLGVLSLRVLDDSIDFVEGEGDHGPL